MNNQYKAAEVIRTWQKRHPIVMESNPDWAAQNLAGDLKQAGLLAADLKQAGLLAADLPEPSYFVTECDERYPVWEATTAFRVEADPYNRDFYIQNSYGPGEPLSLAEIRTIIRYLQAAETYMEEA